MPEARYDHTAVWTGSEMIVWGGYNNLGSKVITGGKYYPGTDSWFATNTANAPEARAYHTAVWTGNEMIVWGGLGVGGNLNSGSAYHPTSNTWSAISW